MFSFVSPDNKWQKICPPCCSEEKDFIFRPTTGILFIYEYNITIVLSYFWPGRKGDTCMPI